MTESGTLTTWAIVDGQAVPTSQAVTRIRVIDDDPGVAVVECPTPPTGTTPTVCVGAICDPAVVTPPAPIDPGRVSPDPVMELPVTGSAAWLQFGVVALLVLVAGGTFALIARRGDKR